MGLLTNRVEKSEIMPGDHIYTYRAVFAYSHHGIFVGDNKVVHFTRNETFSSSFNATECLIPDCGFQKQQNSGVILTCLDCFLNNGTPYRFEYGVSPSVFIAKVRGGACTTALSDSNSKTVIDRAMYLLRNGFGNYNVFQNNSEDFAIYCKTELLIDNRLGIGGRSGQAASVFGAHLVALLSPRLKLIMAAASPAGMATVIAGIYCVSRYATDIGVRKDVVKVPVQDLALNLGWVTNE